MVTGVKGFRMEGDVTLKEKKYFLAYDGEELAASFEGYEDNKGLKILLSICKTEGIPVKDVSEFEYKRQKQLAEEKELNRIGDLIND